MEQFQLQLGPVRKIFGIAELNARIRTLLDEEFSDVWVSGEISGVRLAASGHYYFTLKDGDSQLRCACFRMNARYLKFKPQDGIAVLARGRIDVYEARGEYQLLVEHLEPQGLGALQLAFEQLKTRLAAEGLFDPARKRPLPKFPQRIGIVTSIQGAVIQDILNVLSRRFPGLWIRLYPAQVQGEGSVEQVVRAIRYFGDSGWADVLIVARGGGSLEDLWTFNEEAVVRAIAACPVPVISAVGHETDFTISDFVADLRAATPSAAAELVIGTREQLLDSIEGCRRRLEQQTRYRLNMAARLLHEQGIDRANSILHRRIGRQQQRLDELDRCVADTLRRKIRERADSLTAVTQRLQRLDLRFRLVEVRRRLVSLAHALELAMQGRMTHTIDRLRPWGQRLENALARSLQARRERHLLASSQLEQLSPLRVLDRGYAIVRTKSGGIIKSPAEALLESELYIRVRDGEFAARPDVATRRDSSEPLS
ncbi:MAG: exodeoxyribonuclease VII large subunit [Bryobacteraceae bacterium]|nr:exodeoxyribonuclease VII large subunit [Bryobacteraceae bacterium]